MVVQTNPPMAYRICPYTQEETGHLLSFVEDLPNCQNAKPNENHPQKPLCRYSDSEECEMVHRLPFRSELEPLYAQSPPKSAEERSFESRSKLIADMVLEQQKTSSQTSLAS